MDVIHLIYDVYYVLLYPLLREEAIHISFAMFKHLKIFKISIENIEIFHMEDYQLKIFKISGI